MMKNAKNMNNFQPLDDFWCINNQHNSITYDCYLQERLLYDPEKKMARMQTNTTKQEYINTATAQLLVAEEHVENQLTRIDLRLAAREIVNHSMEAPKQQKIILGSVEAQATIVKSHPCCQ